jgi:hypothetical protein
MIMSLRRDSNGERVRCDTYPECSYRDEAISCYKRRLLRTLASRPSARDVCSQCHARPTSG